MPTIRLPISLMIKAELVKFQQGIGVLKLMIRLNLLLIIIAESMKIQQRVHMQTIMILLYMMLSNQAESRKIWPTLEIHMAPLNGRCPHIIDRTNYTLIT
jgi:hypothetical protein